METDLYSMGAFFCDQHPELVEEVVARSEAIEERGLERWAARLRNPGRGGASARCSPGSRFATTRPLAGLSE